MVRVTLKPSRQLAIALTGAHLGAAATLFPLDIFLWTKLGFAMVVAISLAATIRRHALLASRTAVVAVELHELDRAVLQTRNGLWHDARLLETTYVSPFLSVLNLRITGRLVPRHMLIVKDNVDPEDFRRLRAWLRWGYRKEMPGTRAADPAAASAQRCGGKP